MLVMKLRNSRLHHGNSKHYASPPKGHDGCYAVTEDGEEIELGEPPKDDQENSIRRG